jgi:NAD(P)H-dependent flavin oxidoreductase YrpB (nitropropane dioxygenase family)
MGTMTTPELIAAVCGAGGLGLHGVADMPPDRLRVDVQQIRNYTNAPFGIAIIPRLCSAELIDVAVEQQVPVVNFFWDDVPPDWFARLKGAGVKVWKQVCSVAEAKSCVDMGIDLLIVQGSEAGGHNRAEGTSLSMIPAVCDIAGDVPILSSGGIADGRAAAAALALGADGVCVGTRLLASHEAFAHEEYKRRLVAANVGDSVRTNIFGLEWNDATSRHLRNEVVREWEHRDYPGPYKVIPDQDIRQIGTTELFGVEYPHRQFSIYPPTPSFKGDWEQICMYGGESVGQTKRIMGAGEIVREIMDDAEAIIRNRFGRMIS